ncbi:uncharacterized protein LOC120839178 isoform X2 [Ixodes scapularis]|nr:uncharacterized protein LOC120839178 isoform X2 [Ixodes scapularis]
MAVPFTHIRFLLLMQVVCRGASSLLQRNVSKDTEHPPPSATPVFAFNSDLLDDTTLATCPAPVSGQCPIPAYEPWEDSFGVFSLQKAEIDSLGLGRGTGTVMAVPFTHIRFLLLMQVVCRGASSLLQRNVSKDTEHPPPSATPVFAFNSDLLDDTTLATCPAPVSGQCPIPAYEPWEDSFGVFSLQKAEIDSLGLGRGTGTVMAVPFTHIRFLLLMQVGASFSKCSKFRFALLPVPPHVVFANVRSRGLTCRFRRGFVLLHNYAFYFLLLLLCGDVELNPGPLSVAQENQLVEAMQLIPSMHEGQKTVINELKAIKDLQTTFERKLEGLFSRIAIIESDVAAIKPLRGEFEELKASNRELDTQLRTTALRQEELENQSRRNNLLIYGLPDVAAETWEASEAKALSFFADKLDIHLEATSIERAHRIGRFAADKNRPLISKFLSFKDKQRVLSKAFKLKRSGFSISDDFSPAVQFARRRLLDYASEQNAQFKLRYNKLTIGNKTYMYDPDNDTVFESAR